MNNRQMWTFISPATVSPVTAALHLSSCSGLKIPQDESNPSLSNFPYFVHSFNVPGVTHWLVITLTTTSIRLLQPGSVKTGMKIRVNTVT